MCACRNNYNGQPPGRRLIENWPGRYRLRAFLPPAGFTPIQSSTLSCCRGPDWSNAMQPARRRCSTVAQYPAIQHSSVPLAQNWPRQLPARRPGSDASREGWRRSLDYSFVI